MYKTHGMIAKGHEFFADILTMILLTPRSEVNLPNGNKIKHDIEIRNRKMKMYPFENNTYVRAVTFICDLQ